jgi:hypothetical protein
MSTRCSGPDFSRTRSGGQSGITLLRVPNAGLNGMRIAGEPMKRTLTRTSPNGSALLRQGNGHKVLRRENGQKKQRSAESTRQHYRFFPEAVVVAAERVGQDNSGRNGLIGYLVRLARTEPRSFAALLARTPPDAVIGEKPPPTNGI